MHACMHSTKSCMQRDRQIEQTEQTRRTGGRLINLPASPDEKRRFELKESMPRTKISRDDDPTLVNFRQFRRIRVAQAEANRESPFSAEPKECLLA